MKKIFYLMLVTLTMGMFTACDDDDENTPDFINPEPKEQWSATMRGDNQSIRAYPDIFANYWEYTYSFEKNPNIGLRLTGSFPKARFFNFTIYDDLTQDDMSAIEDVNIKPNEGSINPYSTETEDYGKNTYTINIIPSSTPATFKASLQNVCEFPDTLKMVSVFMRLYLADQMSGEEHGGVDMPAIQAFDVTTGKDVAFPTHEECQIKNIPNVPSANFTDAQKSLNFMRAPINAWYPNSPADYLFTRIKLNSDTLAIFRFVPPVAPTKVSEYATSEVRYWSICLGATNTLSYESSYDEEMPARDSEGFVTIIIADKNSANLSEVQKKAEANKGTYVMTWDRKNYGDGILALYRNMVFSENFEHSMRKVKPIAMDLAGGGNIDMSELMQMLAMPVLGNWGPQGYKFSEDDFLSDSFNYANIRRMK